MIIRARDAFMERSHALFIHHFLPLDISYLWKLNLLTLLHNRLSCSCYIVVERLSILCYVSDPVSERTPIVRSLQIFPVIIDYASKIPCLSVIQSVNAHPSYGAYKYSQ